MPSNIYDLPSTKDLELARDRLESVQHDYFISPSLFKRRDYCPMQPLTITRLALDTSGASPNNRFSDEPHILADYRFRALVPNNGVVFADSVVVKDDATGRVLIKGIDYKFIIPYQSLSILYGKDLVGAIMVISREVSSKVLLTYQALGSDYVHNVPGIRDLLNTNNNAAVSDSYLDVVGNQTSFVPSPHIHDLGDGVGFEYLVFAIETLTRVMMNADGPVIASMIERIDIKLQEIARDAKIRQDTELMLIMEDFRKNFNKEKLGLGNVPNYPEASEAEGQWAATDDFIVSADINNRLVSLKSLVGFRKKLIENLVSKETTHIGKSFGTYMSPTYAGLNSLPNGARVLFDSIDANMLVNASLDLGVYPDKTSVGDRWAVHKVINTPSGFGGVYEATNMTNGRKYSGIMRSVQGGAMQLFWREHMSDATFEKTTQILINHIARKDNPHGLRAYHVGLDKVENLPVADRLTILGRQPKEEYVTHDGLMLFFSAIVAGDWTIDPDEDADPVQKEKARNAYTTLFATAGICGCDDGLNIEIAPRPTTPPIPVKGQPAGWYCEGRTKIARFTDGFGGYELVNTPNSPDCGFQEEVADYEIRDQEGNVIALGFKAGSRFDPAAIVSLQDGYGTAVCLVYPTSAPGRTAAIRDSDGNILGYGINPNFNQG